MVGDALPRALCGWLQRNFEEEFAHIADLALKCFRAPCPLRIVRQQGSVFLQCGPTGGAVADDGIDAPAFEYGNVVAGLALRQIEPAIRAHGHATTFHLLRSDYGTPVVGQHPHRGSALPGKQEALCASKEEAHAVARRAEGYRGLGQNAAQGTLGQPRQHSLQIAELAGKNAVQPQQVYQTANAQFPIEAQRQGGRLHAAGMGYDPLKERPFPPGGPNLFLHVAHRERQLGRLDSHRADLVAGHAGKAAIELLNQVRAGVELPLDAFAGKRHAAPGRSCLLQVLPVGGAGGEAQTTADTIQVRAFRGLDDVLHCIHRLVPHHYHHLAHSGRQKTKSDKPPGAIRQFRITFGYIRM